MILIRTNRPAKKAQAMIESVFLMMITLAFIFGVMDIARFSWTIFHLNGAAFAAARSASVNLSSPLLGPAAAANYITLRTLGVSIPTGVCWVNTSVGSEISTNSDAGTGDIQIAIWRAHGWKPLEKEKLKMKYVDIKLYYYYQPLFTLLKSWQTGSILGTAFPKATCRTFTEAPSMATEKLYN
ncbi:MAG: hypothetical protein BWY26_00797 [Elusimicrobia bacterium ADurb.Bin231]|nr:MAG: hypothetical protein BWY26_00797 [Elusimicrobia bacterium ADurb.Bin231]